MNPHTPAGGGRIAAMAFAAALLSAALYPGILFCGGGVWWGARGVAAVGLAFLFWLVARSRPAGGRALPVVVLLLYLLPATVAWIFEDEGIMRLNERRRTLWWASDHSALRESLDAAADSLLYDCWVRGVRRTFPPHFERITPPPPWQEWGGMEYYARGRGDTTEIVVIITNYANGRNPSFVNADGGWGRAQRRLLMTTLEKRHVIDN